MQEINQLNPEHQSSKNVIRIFLISKIMNTLTFFPLPNKRRKIERIDYADIIYLEGNSNYTLIHLQSGQVKVSPRTLLYHINNTLNESFIRIHRAYCVNKSFIKEYDQKISPQFLLMNGGLKLAVSRRKKKSLEKTKSSF